MAEKMNALRPQVFHEELQFISKPGYLPKRIILHPVGLPAAQLIVKDNRTITPESGKRFQIVMRVAGSTMNHKQHFAGITAFRLVPDPSSANSESSFFSFHKLRFGGAHQPLCWDKFFFGANAALDDRIPADECTEADQ